MKYIAIATMFLLFAAPARAANCQDDIGKIDKAMETSKLDADEKQEVSDLREQAVQLCGAGNESAGMDVTAQAKQILKID